MKMLSILFLFSAFFNSSTEIVDVIPNEMASATALEMEGPQPLNPDLVIASLSLDLGDCDGTVNWEVIVCNNGAGSSGATTANVSIGCALQNQVFSFPVPALGGRQCIRLSGTITTTCTWILLAANVDPDNLVEESNESNNGNSTTDEC